MLRKIKIGRKIKRGDFLKFATKTERAGILKLASLLRGKKILHLNATPVGGGVVELLVSLIPYLNSLGIKNDWYVIDAAKAGKKFFEFCDRLRDALQGFPLKFKAKEWELYQKVNRKIAEDLNKLDYDALVLNDWQPLFSVGHLKEKRPRIYFSHLDTSSPDKKAWQKILPVMKQFDRFVFSNKSFVNHGLPKSKTKIIPPAIDPLSLKQRIVPRARARKYLAGFGISEKGPLVVQVSRFDIWKNPMGVIEAFRQVEKAYPDAKLAMVGFNETKDNPQAVSVHRDVEVVAKTDPNIFIFFHMHHHKRMKSVTHFSMMAQNAADVIVQNSIKEGFGLTLTEAMWKAKPVVAGPASGMRLQIKDGKNGFIVKTPEELAERIVEFLRSPKKRAKLGRAAKESVRKNYLFGRLVKDHLKLYKSVL